MEALLLVQNQKLTSLCVWHDICLVHQTKPLLLGVFKVWGLSVFRTKRTNWWKWVFSLFGFHAGPSLPWSLNTFWLPQKQWLLGVDDVWGGFSNRVVKNLWHTVSGSVVCVWQSLYMWSLPKWNQCHVGAYDPKPCVFRWQVVPDKTFLKLNKWNGLENIVGFSKMAPTAVTITVFLFSRLLDISAVQIKNMETL